MSYHHTYDVQLPRGPPRRAEVNVLKIDPDGNPVFDDDSGVCDCFPRPSKKTIPSMLYDGIKCPHANERHIQPAQTSVFTYPWTASSNRDFHVKQTGNNFRTATKLSTIAEQGPTRISDQRKVPYVVRTAPPNAVAQTTYRVEPPFTAPAPGEEVRFESLEDLRRAESAPEVTNAKHGTPYLPLPSRASYQSEPDISTPFLDYSEPTHDRHIQRKGPFLGHYKDPKNGKVYTFQVKMDQFKNQARSTPLARKAPTTNVR